MLAAAAVALSACDRVDKLEEGVSTEVEVRKQFGDPVTVTVSPDGTRTLDYPRQPEGWTNYVIQIGPDGKMSSLRQLLNEDNFARIQPGMDTQRVRDTLGRPAEQRDGVLPDPHISPDRRPRPVRRAGRDEDRPNPTGPPSGEQRSRYGSEGRRPAAPQRAGDQEVPVREVGLHGSEITVVETDQHRPPGRTVTTTRRANRRCLDPLWKHSDRRGAQLAPAGDRSGSYRLE